MVDLDVGAQTAEDGAVRGVVRSVGFAGVRAAGGGRCSPPDLVLRPDPSPGALADVVDVSCRFGLLSRCRRVRVASQCCWVGVLGPCRRFAGCGVGGSCRGTVVRLVGSLAGLVASGEIGQVHEGVEGVGLERFVVVAHAGARIAASTSGSSTALNAAPACGVPRAQRFQVSSGSV